VNRPCGGLGRLALLLLVPLADLRAATPSTVSATDPAPITWNLTAASAVPGIVEAGQVVFRLHDAGSDDIDDGRDLEAVENAFRTWNGVTGSALRFTRGADLSAATVLADGEFPVFWTEGSTVLTQGTASPDDDVNIAGALAVAFVYRMTSGPAHGEIVDANIAFNGVEYSWTTDPGAQPTRYDIESVALHEIGHALGLDHSPVAAATLFPRVGAGRSLSRSLSSDDLAGLRRLYPGDNTPANRGIVSGLLTGDAPIFGGLVWALDSAGRVAAHGMSDSEGRFTLAGLPPGPVTLYAQPISAAGGIALFQEANLGPYWRGLNRDFQATSGVAVEAQRGTTVVQDLEVSPGPSPIDVRLLGRAGTYSNGPTFLRRGETGVWIGAAGPGLPASGTPLALTGPGLTITGWSFGTVAGFPSAQMRVSVAADAPLGPRDLVLTSAGGRIAAIGGVEILFPASSGPPGPVPAGGPGTRPLTVEQVGPAIDLSWDDTDRATAYRLWRGTLDSLRALGGDHAVEGRLCHISVPDASLFDLPGAGESLYFLVSAWNAAGEGSLGSNSAGTERLAGAQACP